MKEGQLQSAVKCLLKQLLKNFSMFIFGQDKFGNSFTLIAKLTHRKQLLYITKFTIHTKR